MLAINAILLKTRAIPNSFLLISSTKTYALRGKTFVSFLFNFKKDIYEAFSLYLHFSSA